MADDSATGSDKLPAPGEWPEDPQEALPMSKDRIWIDGCFDFSHHGHAGAMLQARRLGKELIVGVHSDEDITVNKGPTVMTLKERCTGKTVGGDGVSVGNEDRAISGQDCYRFVKAAGRFLVVHRTPGISTTDIVGRMLLYSRDHNISSLARVLAGEEGPDPAEQRQEVAAQLKQRIEDFASDETGLLPHCDVWNWSQQPEPPEQPQHGGAGQKHQFTKIVAGQGPREGQRVVYVDGGFDLFSSGQIRFLQMVHEAEEQAGRDCSWDDDSHRKARLDRHGVDYRPAFVVAGVHDDETVQKWKGANYPIMNIIERGLC
ncbi:MAG: hypothetical protein M1815_004794, partial [Lichina confinis]